jgi:O-methyltransferase
VRRLLKQPLRRGLSVFGYELNRTRSPWPRDFMQADIDLCREVAPYTMTTPEAIYVLAEAVRYVVSNGVAGAIVECGVWKGGSMMAVARTLLSLGKTDVDLFLFDTFEGMTEPTERDIHWTGETAKTQLAREQKKETSLVWARATLDQVQYAMRSIPYPASRIHFVEGRVEDTLPDRAPPQIALLRLDTDWYDSTLHELVHLYPRVVPGGILIVDDYGWWRGAAEATDEYFREKDPTPFLTRIDADGVRLAVKPHAAPAC